jgi:hypothetical protein
VQTLNIPGQVTLQVKARRKLVEVIFFDELKLRHPDPGPGGDMFERQAHFRSDPPQNIERFPARRPQNTGSYYPTINIFRQYEYL